jgi:Fic/DOC family
VVKNGEIDLDRRLQKIRCPALESESKSDSNTSPLNAELKQLQSCFADAFSVIGLEQKMQLIIDETHMSEDGRPVFLRPPTEPLIMSTWATNTAFERFNDATRMAALLLCKPIENSSKPMQGIDFENNRVEFESLAERKSWVDDIRQIDAGDRPPLEKAAYRFMRTIAAHPFRDGNGRFARALIYGPFAKADILKLPVLGLNAVFDLNRHQLSPRVAKLSHDGDWPDFVDFFESLLRECIALANEVAARNRRKR